MATLQEVKDRFPFEESYVQGMVEISKQQISLDDASLFRNGPTVLSKSCAEMYMYPSLVVGYFLERTAGIDYFLAKSTKELFSCLDGKLLENQRMYLCTNYEDLNDSKVIIPPVSHEPKDVRAGLARTLENLDKEQQIYLIQKEVETKNSLGYYFDTLSKVVLHFEQGERDQVYLYAKQLMKEVLVDRGVKTSWLDHYHTPLTVYATLLKLLGNSPEQAVGFITASQEMGKKYQLSNSGFIPLVHKWYEQCERILSNRESGTVGLPERLRGNLLELDINFRFMRSIVEPNSEKLVPTDVLELKENYNHVVQEAKPTLDHYMRVPKGVRSLVRAAAHREVPDTTPKPPHNFELMPSLVVSSDKVNWLKWE